MLCLSEKYGELSIVDCREDLSNRRQGLDFFSRPLRVVTNQDFEIGAMGVVVH